MWKPVSLRARGGPGRPTIKLARNGITPTVTARRVGKSLQDHPAVGVVFHVMAPLTADMAALYARFQVFVLTCSDLF